MAKHLIFMLHGMGQHVAEEWHRPALEVLKTVYGDDDYARLRDAPFDATFDVVPITYSDVFEERREQWVNAPASLKSDLDDELGSGDSGHRKAIEKEIDRVAKAISAGGGFFWTHAMDVILYRFFSLVREQVKARVGRAILDTLVQKGSGVPSWSILAHSLGTAVAHNTVNALYGPDPGGGPPKLTVGDTRARTIFMVANVSRVLQLDGEEARDVSRTRVRPGSIQSGATCEYYLNARHRLDWFTIPKPFDVDVWPDAFNANRRRYQHLRCGHILQKNVHDLAHYLRNPAIHVPFFRSILGDEWIPDADLERSQLQFDSETLQGNVDAIRQRLEDLKPRETDGWTALIKAVKNLKQFLDE